jgi:RNA polymerase sigma-70 factor, ECF subfamily
MNDWPAIIRRYAPAVWETALHVLGNEADAADAFQETFVAALAFTRRRHVRNWEAMLRRIASARALDVLRRRLRERARLDGDPPWEDLASPELDPGRHAQERELVETLRRLVAELPDEQAEIYCLRYVHQWSCRQIADELATTENAVGVALNRIRTRLSRDLQHSITPGEVNHER